MKIIHLKIYATVLLVLPVLGAITGYKEFFDWALLFCFTAGVITIIWKL